MSTETPSPKAKFITDAQKDGAYFQQVDAQQKAEEAAVRESGEILPIRTQLLNKIEESYKEIRESAEFKKSREFSDWNIEFHSQEDRPDDWKQIDTGLSTEDTEYYGEKTENTIPVLCVLTRKDPADTTKTERYGVTVMRNFDKPGASFSAESEKMNILREIAQKYRVTTE